MAITRIGNFDIIEELGKGGFGTVYKGVDPELQRHAAIKLVSPAVASDPALVERFRREARVAAALNHPAIVTIYSVGEHEGRPFIAMELLGGKDLSRAGTLPVPRVFRVMSQLADGLGYAHARGVVHRDIKPSNIRLIDETTVKILDFGLASLPASSLTRAGQVFGTLGYASPEQLREAKGVDARSDIFSMGAVFYELLAQRRPFGGDGDAETMVRTINTDPRPLENLTGGPFEPLEGVVLRCLQKDPGARFQTCAEFIEALKTAMDYKASTYLSQAMLAEVAAGPATAGGRAARADDAAVLDELNRNLVESNAVDPLGVADDGPVAAPASDGPDPFALVTDEAPRAMPEAVRSSALVSDVPARVFERPSGDILAPRGIGGVPDPASSEPPRDHSDDHRELLADEDEPLSDLDESTDPRSPWRFVVVAMVVAGAVGAGSYLWLASASPDAAAPGRPASGPPASTVITATPPVPRQPPPARPTTGVTSTTPPVPPGPAGAGATPAVPAPPEGRVRALIAEGSAYAARDDWTRPAGRCALDAYMQAVAADPSSAEARAAVGSVFDFFLQRGDELAGGGDPAAARVRYARAESILNDQCRRAGLPDLAARRAKLDEAVARLP